MKQRVHRRPVAVLRRAARQANATVLEQEVVVRPGDRRVAMPGIDILRVVDGKVVELWDQEDVLGMIR